MGSSRKYSTILRLILLTLGALVQITAAKPASRFTYNNDKFDMSSMMRAHKVNPPVFDENNEGIASEADNRRRLQNDKAFLDLLRQKGPLTRRAEVDFKNDSNNPYKMWRRAGSDLLNLELRELNLFAENIANLSRRNVPNDDHEGEILKKDVEYKLLGKHPVHTFRRVDGSGFAVDDSLFNSFEGGSLSDFEENLKKFYTFKPSNGTTQNGVEEITESGIVLQNASTVMNVVGYLKYPLK